MRPSPPRSCVAPTRARHNHTHRRLSASVSHCPFLHRAAGATTFKPSRIFEVHCSLSSSSFESANHPQQIFKARRRLVLSSSLFHICLVAGSSLLARVSARGPTFLFLNFDASFSCAQTLSARLFIIVRPHIKHCSNPTYGLVKNPSDPLQGALLVYDITSFFKECPHPDEKQRLDLSKRLVLENKQVKF
ncbi:hypothetical protein PIB30_036557 [Stylosanthes scabra]|uniref:Uncharacterized protein n=1 Tax=Stylosanthes scabra TaxID=79078 RepID=A0ABU6WD58_9FABA|nr:hypothetical protein [Stylosanthes scabra]